MIGRIGHIGHIGRMGLMGPIGLIGPIRLIALIALMGLMGCSSEETTRTAEVGSQRAIAFGEAYTVKPTKSSAAFTGDKGIPVGQSIGVYAYLHNTETRNYSADIPNFMFNQQCTRRDDADYFAYSPVKYWPNDENSKVSFIAYFPYCNNAVDDGTRFDQKTTGIRLLKGNSVAGLPTFEFTVKDAVDDQVDFMVSDVMANLPKSRDTENDPGQPFNDLSIQDRVTFLLKHMTAKVEFRIVADPEIHKDIVNFHLSKLNVTNLLTSGKLTPSYDKNSGITSFAWSEQATTHNYDFTTYEPQLLMPQELSDLVKMNVSYTITFKSDGTTYHYDGTTPVADQDYTYEKEDEIQLNKMLRTGTTTPVTEWLPYHHYIYTIRLRANRIEFTGQVVDWGDTHDIEGIEIKDE